MFKIMWFRYLRVHLLDGQFFLLIFHLVSGTVAVFREPYTND